MSYDEYDLHVDTIICSKDFDRCKSKDEEGTCTKENTRCWHVSKCPKGYERK